MLPDQLVLPFHVFCCPSLLHLFVKGLGCLCPPSPVQYSVAEFLLLEGCSGRPEGPTNCRFYNNFELQSSIHNPPQNLQYTIYRQNFAKISKAKNAVYKSTKFWPEKRQSTRIFIRIYSLLFSINLRFSVLCFLYSDPTGDYDKKNQALLSKSAGSFKRGKTSCHNT
jgi:hypothetical protein